jgi:hypothetical protein
MESFLEINIFIEQHMLLLRKGHVGATKLGSDYYLFGSEQEKRQ